MKTAINLRRTRSPLLASMLAASLVLALPVQTRSESGISTTQAANPNPATVEHPLTFTVTVTNNSASQHVGLKDFFPEGAELVSATPGELRCGPSLQHRPVHTRRSAKRRLSYVRGHRAPDGPGNAKTTAVDGGEHFPEVSEATVEVKPAPQADAGCRNQPLRAVSRLVHEEDPADSMRRRSYFRVDQITPL